MSTILRLLFANGASTVAAVRVAEAGAVKDYQDAFAALGGEEARILVCDSAEETVRGAADCGGGCLCRPDGADRRGGRRR